MYDHAIDSIAEQLGINVEAMAQEVIAQISPKNSSTRIISRPVDFGNFETAKPIVCETPVVELAQIISEGDCKLDLSNLDEDF